MKKDPCQHLYDEMTEEGREDSRHHHSPPQRFRASEAAHCMRRLWYRLSGARPAPKEAIGRMYGYGGDADHDLARQVFRHYGVDIGGITFKEDGSVEEQMWFQKTVRVEIAGQEVEITISGRADGEIETPRGKELLEIKGTGFWRFDWLRKDYESGGLDKALKRVKVKHKEWFWQCQITMFGTGHKLCYLVPKDRSSGTLGLYDADSGMRSGVYLEAEQAVLDEILKRFAHVKRMLVKGTPPRPEFPDGSTDCNQCPFHYLCHGAEKRRSQGIEPTVVYPGPCIEEHHARPEE